MSKVAVPLALLAVTIGCAAMEDEHAIPDVTGTWVATVETANQDTRGMAVDTIHLSVEEQIGKFVHGRWSTTANGISYNSVVVGNILWRNKATYPTLLVEYHDRVGERCQLNGVLTLGVTPRYRARRACEAYDWRADDYLFFVYVRWE